MQTWSHQELHYDVAESFAGHAMLESFDNTRMLQRDRDFAFSRFVEPLEASLELAKFLLTEKIAGFHLYHLHGEVRFDFSFFDTPTYTEHLWLLLLLPAIGA